ncbi:MAG TPA: glycosyltransferase 87 family protein [Humibacter sp.]|nr:glycosyltransferase 87 family protein [Humibacter sp.]
MTSLPTPRSRVHRLIDSRVAQWSAFVVVHIVVIGLALLASQGALGDVGSIYRPLALHAERGFVPGIDGPWVYPLLAWAPILAPLVFGNSGYIAGWLVLVVAADAVGFAALTVRGDHRRVRAAWWWLGFSVLLGPIAVSRLDTISVPLVILALLWLGSRPRSAAVLLTIATWIKVWPAAVLVALVVASRNRRVVAVTAVLTSAAVVVVALILGAGANVYSFVTAQADRGLQVEAPVSTGWMWQASAGRSGAAVYYDRSLNTFEVSGHGVQLAAMLMTPLLAVAVIALVALGVRATRAGVGTSQLLPPLTLALVTAMVVFNKVGSPQYLLWFAAPVVIGLVHQGRRFRIPAVLVAAAATLTQGFYPYLYGSLLRTDPGLLLVLTARNLVLLAVLGWSLWSLITVAGPIRVSWSSSPSHTRTTR